MRVEALLPEVHTQGRKRFTRPQDRGLLRGHPGFPPGEPLGGLGWTPMGPPREPSGKRPPSNPLGYDSKNLLYWDPNRRICVEIN